MCLDITRRIVSVYVTGSSVRGEYCHGKSSFIDLLVFTDTKPYGYPWLIAAPLVRAIVLPHPRLLNNLLPNIVTGLPSKLTTTRVSLEKKVHVHGKPLELEVYEEYDADDVRHYILYLWIMYLTAKRVGDLRLSCKLLYEVLWFHRALMHKPIEFSWRNIASIYCDHEIVDYCLDILTCRHRGGDPIRIASEAFSIVEGISKELYGKEINDIVWDIEYFARTAPRLREEDTC